MNSLTLLTLLTLHLKNDAPGIHEEAFGTNDLTLINDGLMQLASGNPGPVTRIRHCVPRSIVATCLKFLRKRLL